MDSRGARNIWSGVYLAPGSIELMWFSDQPLFPGKFEFHSGGADEPASLRSVLRPDYESNFGGHWLSIPLWMPLLLSAIPVFILWRSHFRANRAARINVCPKCNYSLTGLPPSSPCPECGGGKPSPS